MNTKVMFSANKDDWETPDELFKRWDECFIFTLDVCASKENAKVPRYFTKEQDGLKQDWSGNVCWCNPPYGKEIGKWVDKAWEEKLKGVTTVMLLPARTDTKWFHKYIDRPGVKVVFIKGRLKFKGAPASAPFPSMMLIFEGVDHGT